MIFGGVGNNVAYQRISDGEIKVVNSIGLQYGPGYRLLGELNATPQATKEAFTERVDRDMAELVQICQHHCGNGGNVSYEELRRLRNVPHSLHYIYCKKFGADKTCPNSHRCHPTQ